MSVNYALPVYDGWRNWIKRERSENVPWESIKFANRGDENGLQKFIDGQLEFNPRWAHITIDDWYHIVDSQKSIEDRALFINELGDGAMIVGDGDNNDVSVPTDPYSSWQTYRNTLAEQGFKEDVLDNMEQTTLRILKRLSNNTIETEAVKGLVVGNVQSGKTANMAALMAMAADWGWNMFIVLSGTIDNLRRQTQNRLLRDLNHPGNLRWIGLEHLSKKVKLGNKPQDLFFNNDSKERYFTVCLKNTGRLKNLIQWLQMDPKSQKQMKILLIDDEADQAGINTAKISNQQRRAINGLICNLVNGLNEKGQSSREQYKAMNYIGYTATPYANILNETELESLYPKDFITTLSVSNEYFGPQQIFGVEDADFDGLDIVRIIDDYDLECIKEIHDGEVDNLPTKMIESICWFLCSASCFRYWDYRKPVSMLIHTSQKTDHHKNIADKVKEWFSINSVDEIVEQCKDVWQYETSIFSKNNFRQQYPTYGIEDDKIKDYPSFNMIKPYLVEMVKENISYIHLDEEGEFEYRNGIHLCIDNCRHNGINSDKDFVRLAYPDVEHMPSKAPAFIVIGGATLSRGLTLEGLVSTFFLRSVGQADTLMQMGRWFGYRKGYELLPRLWLTEKTNSQFKFLSSLDLDLRNEIKEMEVIGRKPSEYGPRVKNTPKYSFIRITAKNRMQSAQISEFDYSGSSNQTYLFDNNLEIINHNFDITTSFVTELGDPEENKPINIHSNQNKIWRNVEFSNIKTYLKNYKYQSRLNVLNNIDSLCEWIEKSTNDHQLDNWNVIFASPIHGEVVKIGSLEIRKVQRTKKNNPIYDDLNILNIGALRSPGDLLSDVDLTDLPNQNELQEMIRIANGNMQRIGLIRNIANLGNTPQLIIYCVDKKSDVTSPSKHRTKLNAPGDIIGLCINLPGKKRGSTYGTTIQVKIQNNVFDDNGDMEGLDEN